MGNKFQRKNVVVLIPEQVQFFYNQGRDIRGEYRVLRKIAEQRLRDMTSAGYGGLDVVRNYKNRFPTLNEIGTKGKEDVGLLSDAYAEVTRFLNLRTTTVGGYRSAEKQARETFSRHYGDELPEMPHGLFGEMMRAIKGAGDGKAYYGQWKKTYRALLSNADKSGLSLDDLEEAVKNGEISIGPKGGLYDESTGARIRGMWHGMGY